MIKKIFKTNTIAYLFWYFINRPKLSFRLPTKNDNLYFDGFPRSGNTYAMGLLNYIFKLQYTSHMHTIIGFKIATFYKTPIITIIREPLDAISSLLYAKINRNEKPSKGDLKEQISDLLIEYCYYYNFIFKNINKTYIINFKTIINDPEIVINDIEMQFSFKKKSNKENSELIKNFTIRLHEKEKNKEVAYSSFPKEERINFKKNVKNLIENDINYFKANNIFNKLVKY